MIRFFKTNSIITCLIIFPFFLNTLYADEIDLNKTEALFIKMFGDEYNKVISTSIKTDDEKFAEDILSGATALSSNPDLQVYLKWKAAEIFSNSEKSKKQSRDLYKETFDNLPESVQKESAIKIFELQKSIVNSVNPQQKNILNEEADFLIAQAILLSDFYGLDSDYQNALQTLRDVQRYIKPTDKDALVAFNKKIAELQKASNRYNQILPQIKLRKNNPNDEKLNQEIADYFLFERNNIFMAWPYLESLKNDLYNQLCYNIFRCMTDENKVTADSLSLQLIPMIRFNPEYILNTLSKKDVVDPEELLKQQLDLLKNNKKIQPEKIKKIIVDTIAKNGTNQITTYKNYLNLSENLDALMENFKLNKKLDAETLQNIKTILVTSKYIALMKANLKSTKESIPEDEKIKLEMNIGKTKNSFKELKLEEFQVDTSTLFPFQLNSFSSDKIELSSEGIYSFNQSSYQQFLRDFTVTVDGVVFNSKESKAISNQDGCLSINDKKPILIKSNKRKWNSNIEVSFEIFKSYENLKQTLNFILLFKPDETGYRKAFGVHYQFFLRGGWFGVIRNGEGHEDFVSSKLTKRISPDSDNTSIWKNDKLKISAIIKDKKLEITIDDEVIISNLLSDISGEKNFPDSPIQIYFNKRSDQIDLPVKIDNLYIGPPRKIKK